MKAQVGSLRGAEAEAFGAAAHRGQGAGRGRGRGGGGPRHRASEDQAHPAGVHHPLWRCEPSRQWLLAWGPGLGRGALSPSPSLL